MCRCSECDAPGRRGLGVGGNGRWRDPHRHEGPRGHRSARSSAGSPPERSEPPPWMRCGSPGTSAMAAPMGCGRGSLGGVDDAATTERHDGVGLEVAGHVGCVVDGPGRCVLPATGERARPSLTEKRLTAWAASLRSYRLAVVNSSARRPPSRRSSSGSSRIVPGPVSTRSGVRYTKTLKVAARRRSRRTGRTRPGRARRTPSRRPSLPARSGGRGCRPGWLG